MSRLQILAVCPRPLKPEVDNISYVLSIPKQYICLQRHLRDINPHATDLIYDNNNAEIRTLSHIKCEPL